jgi:spore germination cell wall hydrolase CwlJ-like protein
MRWALATAAPWALSTALLVSFTASAGQPRDNAETLVLRLEPETEFGPATGPSLLSAASAFNLPALSLNDALIPGRYQSVGFSYEEPARLVPMNEFRPRGDLKASVTAYPELDRTRKADPLVGLRPSMSRAPSELSGDELDRLFFENGHGGLSSQFAPDSAEMQREPGGFAPFDYAQTPSDALEADASPLTSSLATPATAPWPRGAERQMESIDGSTPSTPRALVLSSATPVPLDLMPVEIAAAPVTRRASTPSTAPLAADSVIAAARSVTERPTSGGRMRAVLTDRAVTIVGKARPAPSTGSERRSAAATASPGATATPAAPGERPNYAALISADSLDAEQRCLAEAVYYEARSEPEEGQAAVAQVVLNRVKSGLYPDKVCGVVYQNRHRHLACQFTFACEGRVLRINEPEAWATASRVAREVMEGRTYLADVGNSTHYHANYIRPWWARRLTKMDSIGRHVFYKLKPGQT